MLAAALLLCFLCAMPPTAVHSFGRSAHRPRIMRRQQTMVSQLEETPTQTPAATTPAENNNNNDNNAGRRVEWKAFAKSSVRVKETQRSVEEYMRLPATEYSVLSADQVQRLSDTSFKFNFPALNFFGNTIQPILYVDVDVQTGFNRSEIVVRRAETVGSEAAALVNGSFTINATNLVYAATDSKGRKTLNSETSLFIDVLVPPSSKVPHKVIQSTGNFLMQSSLNIIVPTFTRVLSSDFARWSAGNDSRTAVEGAVLST
jgi:hypothetical protein